MKQKVLGIGKRRIVVSNGDGTCIKIPINFDGKYANYYEWENYNNLSEEDKKYMCPLLKFEHGLIWAKELSSTYVCRYDFTMNDYLKVFNDLFPAYATIEYINKLLSLKIASKLSVGKYDGRPVIFDIEDQHDWYYKVGNLDIREQLGDTLESTCSYSKEGTWLMTKDKFELFPQYYDEVINKELTEVPVDFITWYYEKQGKQVVSFETELQKRQNTKPMTMSTMMKSPASFEPKETIIISPMSSPG